MTLILKMYLLIEKENHVTRFERAPDGLYAYKLPKMSIILKRQENAATK